jgi:hypothetical protein
MNALTHYFLLKISRALMSSKDHAAARRRLRRHITDPSSKPILRPTELAQESERVLNMSQGIYDIFPGSPPCRND